MREVCWLLAIATSAACGDPSADGPNAGDPSPKQEPPIVQAEACPPGTTAEEDGCRPAGVLPQACEPGQRLLAGECVAAGVPPQNCGTGFASSADDGCEPILPPIPCGAGEMALPGETSCRGVQVCDGSRWGAIATSGDTEYVDAAYLGGPSDGSAERPWKTISEGMNAAAAGAVVAIAAGRYAESLALSSKPLTLWGACSSGVEIAGQAAQEFAIDISGAASGSELRDLSVTGARGRGDR